MSSEKETPWHKGLVNYHQTSEERQGKYRLCRDLGANSYHAQSMRDWRLSKIERFFNSDALRTKSEGFITFINTLPPRKTRGHTATLGRLIIQSVPANERARDGDADTAGTPGAPRAPTT